MPALDMQDYVCAPTVCHEEDNIVPVRIKLSSDSWSLWWDVVYIWGEVRGFHPIYAEETKVRIAVPVDWPDRLPKFVEETVSEESSVLFGVEQWLINWCKENSKPVDLWLRSLVKEDVGGKKLVKD